MTRIGIFDPRGRCSRGAADRLRRRGRLQQRRLRLILLLPVTAIALVLLMAGLARRRLRPSRSRAGSLTESDDTTNEQVLRAELSVLADDVIRLEPRVRAEREVTR